MSDLPLSAGELVEMRHTVGAYLPGTAVIHIATKAGDGQGGYTWTYAAASTVSARLAPISAGDELPLAGRLAEVQQFVLTAPWTASIDEDDRVVYASNTYEVAAVQDRTPWDLDRRAVLVRVD